MTWAVNVSNSLLIWQSVFCSSFVTLLCFCGRLTIANCPLFADDLRYLILGIYVVLIFYQMYLYWMVQCSQHSAHISWIIRLTVQIPAWHWVLLLLYPVCSEYAWEILRWVVLRIWTIFSSVPWPDGDTGCVAAGQPWHAQYWPCFIEYLA
jgi:hypothetical protein